MVAPSVRLHLIFFTFALAPVAEGFAYAAEDDAQRRGYQKKDARKVPEGLKCKV
jgi:hypothetical protein